MTARINRDELQQIVTRLNTPLNDDGYRAWYTHDVAALMHEVLGSRADLDRARAALVSQPPLSNEDTAGLELLALIDRVLKVVAQASEGVWQRAEVKRIKGTIDSLTEERDALTAQLAEAQTALDERAEHVASLGRMISTVASENTETLKAADNERARLVARLDGTLAEVTDLKGQLQEAILTARADQLRMAQEFDRRMAEARTDAEKAIQAARGETDAARRVAQAHEAQSVALMQRLGEVHDLMGQARNLSA